jgi:hypothetical protein
MYPLMPQSDRSHGPNDVSRIDVARRQISAAIHMFFRRHDPVVIHSVAVAACHTLAGLGLHGRLAGLRKERENQSAANHAADLFDQAGPGDRINVERLAQANAEILMDAILMLQPLYAPIPVGMKIFSAWFVTTHAELFDISTLAMPRPSDNDVDPDDFDQIAALITFLEITEEGASES